MKLLVKFTDKAIELSQKLGIDFTPTKSTTDAAAFDLKACIEETYFLPVGETCKIFTGCKISLGNMHKEMQELSNGELGVAALYLPRSSAGISLENTVGLLDADFTNESFLKVKNNSNDLVVIKPGDRIAQLVTMIIATPKLVVVEDITSTERGEGDGSSGETVDPVWTETQVRVCLEQNSVNPADIEKAINSTLPFILVNNEEMYKKSGVLEFLKNYVHSD